MILIDNLNILKNSYPDIWNKLKQIEDKENRILFNIEETRNGEKTLAVTKDDKKVYLHSKYNPIKEAETIVDSFDDIDENTNIIFYGTSLGYHIQLMLEEYNNIKYYIYEPIPELLYAFLSNVNLKDLNNSRLMGISIGFSGNTIDKFVDRNRDKIKIVELPSHKQNFEDENEDFNQTMLKIIKDKRRTIATNYSFQKRWIINSMKNLKEVLSTPNIILEKKGEFKDKTAILVAAGPSLNDEIENLRYIKENGLAYIFSVGSAINTLIYNDIYPDAACTYDPTVKNQTVFEKVKEKGIKNIAMIFGSSVGYETLENYPGDKYHMITSQDTVARYFLKDEGGKGINIVQDAPSIAVVTLQLLYTLGFSNIILVGQNLGYRGKERYSEGISYRSELTDKEIENSIWVKDVYGNEILTNESLDSMRQQIELYIKLLPNINVINTTKGGANIEGTQFKELKDFMETTIKDKIVEKNRLSGNKTIYDKKHILSQTKSMDKSFANAKKINKEYKLILSKIEKSLNNRNFSEIEKLYIKLDKELKKIENNEFYKTFILPMNRVQYKVLADSIDDLNEEKNPYQKSKRILDIFGMFISICSSDIEMLKPVYDEMMEDIINYISI
ncbi:6-hydroxymethylpterin diphosphokinase MptE-like protein [Tissierella sp. Yu-01]|uniref:motility associated factor glycosyltransferase family protein n=1 Tax=Tissierella sp. Yu-01 TaxID=3035694 RepID=UPI00240D4A08|nr:6-hydroxymethylpterin diphosphokinase MptE-like protein [Tissierella sp. Yu-01]WFA07913.1 DUF115 domain-containing protein [Tissierella sp. Yu-01]